MNRKGFTLIEMLACLAILGLVLGIGLYATKDTLATTFVDLNKVSDNEIFDTAEVYVQEYPRGWNTDTQGNEYTCLDVKELVDYGYFDETDVGSSFDKIVKIIRNMSTKVVIDRDYNESCE